MTLRFTKNKKQKKHLGFENHFSIISIRPIDGDVDLLSLAAGNVGGFNQCRMSPTLLY